jgi:hypothetical protein
MAVAERFGFSRFRAPLDRAWTDLAPCSLFWISMFQPPPIVHLAKASGPSLFFAVACRALHEENVRVGCDRFDEKRASPGASY